MTYDSTVGADTAIVVPPEVFPGRTAVVAASSSPRFDGFDGLRALAAILVVLHHASFESGRQFVGHFSHQLTQLDIGVAIFFLISGFLLYRPFAQRIMTAAVEPSVPRYLVRRAARIFPAYWLALTTIIVVGKLTDGRLLGLSEPPKSRWGYLPYYGLVHVYRNLREATGGLNQAWTLAVEITFYVLLPVYAMLVRKCVVGRTPKRSFQMQLWLLLGLASTGIAFRSYADWFATGRIHNLGPYWIIANLDLFALGMLLATLSVGYDHDLGPCRVLDWAATWGELWWVIAVAGFWIGANGLGVGITVRPMRWQGLYKQELHGVLAFLLLLPVVFTHRRRTAVMWFLRQRLVVSLGVVSYGIYLWHQSWIGQAFKWQYKPVFFADMRLLVIFGLSVSSVCAAASWFGFERPIVRRVGVRS